MLRESTRTTVSSNLIMQRAGQVPGLGRECLVRQILFCRMRKLRRRGGGGGRDTTLRMHFMPLTCTLKNG